MVLIQGCCCCCCCYDFDERRAVWRRDARHYKARQVPVEVLYDKLLDKDIHPFEAISSANMSIPLLTMLQFMAETWPELDEDYPSDQLLLEDLFNITNWKYIDP